MNNNQNQNTFQPSSDKPSQNFGRKKYYLSYNSE